MHSDLNLGPPPTEARDDRSVDSPQSLRPGRAQLYEARDLKPTLGLDALIGGAVAAHFALDPALAVPQLFPGSTGAAVGGLIRG